jgi:hypothetical protein
MANFFDYLDKSKDEEKQGVTPSTVRKGNYFDYVDESEEAPIAAPVQEPVKAQTDAALAPKPVIPPEPAIPTGPQEDLPEDQQVVPAKQPDKVTVQELTSPENIKIIKDYAEARFGESGKQKEDESDEDYVGRWMTAMRLVEWNTGMNAVPELNWIYNANDQDLLKASAAHQLYERVPNFWEEGGESALKALGEGVLGVLSDPTNLTSFGVGAFAKYKAAREGIKFALKDKLKTVAAIGTLEGSVGAGQAAVEEQIKVETGIKDEIDKSNIAIGALLGSTLGSAEAYSVFRRGPKVTTKKDLEKVLESRTPTPPDDAVHQRAVDIFNQDVEDTLRELNLFEGRKTLDELSPRVGEDPALVVGEVGKDISRRAIKVAEYVLLNDPAFSETIRKVGTREKKTSDAVNEVFSSIDGIDDTVLESAISKAGLTPAEFANAALTTVSDAASVMQGYSSLARTLRKIAEIDPEAQKVIDSMYGRDQEVVSTAGKFLNGIRRLERESKALVVSSIGTTVRNAYGTTTGLLFDTGARAFENVLYGFGNALKLAANPTSYKKGDFTAGLNKAVRDTFGTLTYLTNGGITAEVADKLLAHNPKLKENLFSALQESGNERLSKVARMANTFNVAQDAMFRRAIFTASVERQLRNVGMDMYQLIKDEKNIPADVLKNAADDALKGTFSYMPKPAKKGQVTLEAQAEGLANQFVRFFENVPGGSLMVTFPRFMTNAMAFQYKYSPVGATSGMFEMLSAAKKFKSDPEAASRLYQEGVQKFSRGMVGVAAIGAAMNYREQNQDTEWYNIKGEDGSTVDTRAIFPIGPYLAVGDFLAKMKQGKTADANLKEMIETIVGMKMPAGSQATFLDTLPDLIAETEGKEADKIEKALGKLVGDFVGRFIQPGQPLFQYYDLYDRDAAIARDPNVIESDNLFTEAALNRIKIKLPELKEDLPEAVRYFREEAPMRGGEFFNTLMGVRNVPRANKLEEEFRTLNLDPYKFYSSTGDKTYDRALINNARPFVEQRVLRLIDSPRYDRMTFEQKKIAIRTNMQSALSNGRSITQAKMTASDRDRVSKMTFNKMPALERRAINELYAQNNGGRTMDQDKAYDQVHRYKALLSRYR